MFHRESTMPFFTRQIIALAMAWLYVGGAFSMALGREITVALESGRTFTAMLDYQTDSHRLVLSFERPGLQLLRPIEWSRVQYVLANGKRLTAADVLALVDAHDHANRRDPFTDDVEELPAGAPTVEGPRVDFDVQHAAYAAPEVRTLLVEARVANWDGDVENDGLIVHVYPLDEDGRVAPSAGMLDVELIGQLPATRSYGQPVATLERWTRRVMPEEVGPSGAVLKLPFGQAHPDFDLKIGSFGAVHARFSVPGAGTFEDTADMVRIREYSSIRDRLEQLRGVRTFDNERTGRGAVSGSRP